MGNPLTIRAEVRWNPDHNRLERWELAPNGTWHLAQWWRDEAVRLVRSLSGPRDHHARHRPDPLSCSVHTEETGDGDDF